MCRLYPALFKEKSKPESSSAAKSNSNSPPYISNNSAAVPPVGSTVQMESCSYTKTSGSGSNYPFTASYKGNGNTKSYWSAYITDGNKINGSVSFVTVGQRQYRLFIYRNTDYGCFKKEQ